MREADRPRSHAAALGSLCCLLVWTGGLAAGICRADDTASPAIARPLKLTLGNYFYDNPTGHYSGQDLNLRYRRGDSTVFVGYYRDREFGGQARAGFDSAWQPFKAVPVTILPAVGVATRGFVGGSLVAQVGTTWYAQAGLGRTNLRPFANLNFDPNDALSFAVGHHADDGSSYSLSTVADDRLHTGQRHTHLIGQWPLFDGQRLTVDILRKTGDGDTGHVSAWGETVTYDFPRWFIRESYDPKQNFSAADVTRVSVGARF